jgi:hypothetical protein
MISGGGRPAGTDGVYRYSSPDTTNLGCQPDNTVTAASDERRTTVLLSHWSSKLEDATDISFPVRITGITGGLYQLDIEWIGAGNEMTPGFVTMPVESMRGVLTLPEDVRVPGQSVVRLDIRAEGVAPLSVLTTQAGAASEGACI